MLISTGALVSNPTYESEGMFFDQTFLVLEMKFRPNCKVHFLKLVTFISLLLEITTAAWRAFRARMK